MNPRQIEVHIEELVLHGFDPSMRRRIGDAVESELRGLLTERGLPAVWERSAETIEADGIDSVVLTKPGAAGEQIARAVYGVEGK